jgi:hypothetical protein
MELDPSFGGGMKIRLFGLLYQPAMIDDDKCGAVVIGRGTEVLGVNLPQCHFVCHKSHMT